MDTAIIIKNPKVDISKELLAELETQIHEQGQVVVHCIQETIMPSFIRIWPTTFLYDHHSEHKSELVHAENITYFPNWQIVDKGENYFTLIFSGLPKSCIVFDLIEHCSNEGGAFKALNIVRNKSDVYYVKV
ncbi:MAG: hypothetical protein HKO66_14680 [Saprospiraceae bacterium]|nr:hypothetical protein [Bacteroidia bacterium]NNL93484.1 hypothetical protein [Saprospiraceae bacterium]